MATYYVGIGGNDANDGTSWSSRKLTLNGAEDIPVAAGDTVYVGAGTYREVLACDVNGSSGSPITYIGDYDGSHTDGTGGLVRITGSDDDETITRNTCITCRKNYRTFKGFLLEFANGTYGSLYASDIVVDHLTVENCTFAGERGIRNANYEFTNLIVRNCVFNTHQDSVYDGRVADNTNNLIENCLFYSSDGSIAGVISTKSGGTTIRNCTFVGAHTGVNVSSTLNSGQVVTVNNCLFHNVWAGLKAVTLGNLVEDYNNLYRVEVARTNVNTGAHSTAIIPSFDYRWTFELFKGGKILTPFDLASYSQLIDVAGTNPTTTDMRGTAKQGTEREWGALEYDSTLDIEAGSGGGGSVKILPLGRIGL